MKKDIPSGWEKETTLIHVSISSIVYCIIIGYALIHGTRTVDTWAYVLLFIGSAVVFYWIPTGFVREYYYHGAVYKYYTISNPNKRKNGEIADYISQHAFDSFDRVERIKVRWAERLFLVRDTLLAFDGDKRKRMDIHVDGLRDGMASVVILVTPAAFGLIPRIEALIGNIFPPGTSEYSMT